MVNPMSQPPDPETTPIGDAEQVESDLPTTAGEPVEEPHHDPGRLDAPAVPFIERRTAPRMRIESLFVRLIATSGIVGVSVAIAAIMGTQGVAAWIIGLVASAVSVVLAAILWSSRTL